MISTIYYTHCAAHSKKIGMQEDKIYEKYERKKQTKRHSLKILLLGLSHTDFKIIILKILKSKYQDGKKLAEN